MGQVSVTISSFNGTHRFLSNFYPAPVTLAGEVYRTVEHAYVAAKTNDTFVRATIRGIAKPGDVKRVGRKIDLRADWDSVKLTVMEDLVRQKFQVEPLRTWLVATGDQELIEGNHWGDRFWGMCQGTGENHLGKILMKVRGELK